MGFIQGFGCQPQYTSVIMHHKVDNTKLMSNNIMGKLATHVNKVHMAKYINDMQMAYCKNKSILDYPTNNYITVIKYYQLFQPIVA